MQDDMNVLVKQFPEQLNVKKVYLSNSALISLFITALLVIFYYFQEDKDSSLSLLSLISGALTFIYSVIKLIFGEVYLNYIPTSSRVKQYSIFFDQCDEMKVREALKYQDVNQLGELKKVDSGNLRLDLSVSRDLKFCAAKLYVYVPYCFKAQGDAVVLNDTGDVEIEKLLARIG